MGWEPKPSYSLDEIIETDRAVRAMADISVTTTEHVFRIDALGLEWDIGLTITEPVEAKRIPRCSDGRRIGFFLLHGGSGDCMSLAGLARTLAGKYGYCALAMTFPGRHYFPAPSRDWPGDSINADGSLRTPIWLAGENISRDDYDIVQDVSKRDRYGTRTLARARPGSRFYDRMASWPVAFEEAMLEASRRYFPENEWAFFTHGHSTGGAFSAMLAQKAANAAGQTEIETAPIGYINAAKHDWSGALGKVEGFDRVSTKASPRDDAFHDLSIRTWRDLARYRGPEALGQEGPRALMRLPSLMEEVLDAWDRAKRRPQFKAEYIVTHNVTTALTAAACVVAERLRLNASDREALIRRYLAYGTYDNAPNAKPVPPILYINSLHSRDNSMDAYNAVVLPMLAKLNPAPKARAVHFLAGTHVYYKPDAELANGLVLAAAHLWNEAITNRFFD